MRRGPDYGMAMDSEDMTINIPWELAEEFEGGMYVNWHDNGDGTYTIRLTGKAVDGAYVAL